ncbi:hypothetical protein DLAC_07009 [Tieghemostelium lacteum]|uniref:F-box domain-containing protein n=1 Tax=Tieghemostelium lacteum TaxID=361077 RepID=A0A151ZE01_TIELA|nr:hypothetical protein DLAC_07009 [Tieghemostelium lacteum]|eukprot:KYQ92167.1 hypothetical protein DLAC_07009 [Tieghemostelium lacteum]
MANIELNADLLERILNEPDIDLEEHVHNINFNNNLEIEEDSTSTEPNNFNTVDLISELPCEIIRLILSRFDTSSLLTVSLVSTLFNNLSNDFEIWKQKCLFREEDHYYTMEKTTFLNVSESNVQQDDKHVHHSLLMTKRQCRLYSSDLEPYSNDYKAWKRLYFELGSITFDNSFDLISNAVECSSCDDDQVIDNTLECNKKFWSSKGNADSNSIDYLVYRFHQISVVSSVKIHVFKANFQAGMPTYSPVTLRISVGFSPDVYHYKSEEFTVKRTEEAQQFSLEPRLVVGSYLRIDLIGKHQIQSNDNLYYTVLRYVCADGLPIGSLDPCAELSLSMMKLRSKYIDIKSDNEFPDESSQEQYEKSLHQLKSQIAPKLDKKRIYNGIIQSVLKDLFEQQFSSAIDTIFQKNIRSPKIFNLLLQSKNSEALSKYFCSLLDRGDVFSQEESLFFTREAIESNNISLFTKLFLADKIHSSDQLGEYLLLVGLPIVAAEVFSRSLIPDKVILCLFISGSHLETVHLMNNIGATHQFSYDYLIEMFKSYSMYQAYLFTLTILNNLPEFFDLSPEILKRSLELQSDSIESQKTELSALVKVVTDYQPPLHTHKFFNYPPSILSGFFQYFEQKIKSNK